MTPRLAWRFDLGAPARGLALAREANVLLAWSDTRLILLNHAGRPEFQTVLAAPLTAAAIADDGSACACADTHGGLARLGPDLVPVWGKRLRQPAAAVALEPLGHHLAAADARGKLALFDAAGELAAHRDCPRPPKFLAFAAAQPLIAAAADFGFVGVCEPFGVGWRWQDRPIAHAGSLSFSLDGDTLALALFSDGVRRYGPGGVPLPKLPGAHSARVALSHDGRDVLTADAGGALSCYRDGATRWEWAGEGALTGLALAALGDRAYTATAGGQITALTLA